MALYSSVKNYNYCLSGEVRSTYISPYWQSQPIRTATATPNCTFIS